jgi:hypothetical protein
MFATIFTIAATILAVGALVGLLYGAGNYIYNYFQLGQNPTP